MHHTNHHGNCQNLHCHCRQLTKALPITLSNNHRWRFERDVGTITDSSQANERLFSVRMVSCCHNYTTDTNYQKKLFGIFTRSRVSQDFMSFLVVVLSDIINTKFQRPAQMRWASHSRCMAHAINLRNVCPYNLPVPECHLLISLNRQSKQK
jgi:hypothetical protein